MTLIDDVKNMQGLGMPENDIIQKLKEDGYNPQDITRALEQSKIKAAVNEETVQNSVITSMSEMQPSMMQQPPQEQAPAPGEEYIYPTPQAYQGYEVYQPPQMSSETMTEIAEQIFIEKISEIKKALSSIVDFRTMTEAKISGIDERLRRIETIIDKLQASIIGRIGEYGQAVQNLKSELIATQQSFSKVVNPAVDKAREKQVKGKKAKPGFEDYLR